jgi:hypothetical protein
MNSGKGAQSPGEGEVDVMFPPLIVVASGEDFEELCDFVVGVLDKGRGDGVVGYGGGRVQGVDGLQKRLN